jgi:glycosyltransferase involved in cell wall biosynthesis
MKLSIVIPMLNEEESIQTTVPTIISKISKFCTDLELLAVDDGSTDATNKILVELQKKDKRIKIITHPKNLGYGAALKSGVKAAIYDWIFFTDADLQFDVSEIKKFLSKTKDYDFIVGFRKKRADPLRRRIASFIYNRTIRLLFGLKLHDVDCAFKLMKKTAVKNVNITSNSFFMSVELMVKAFQGQYKITEIGVDHFPRLKGNSTVTFRQMSRSIADLFTLYTSLL